MISTATSYAMQGPATPWLRNRTFDTHFIWSTLMIACAMGIASAQRPELFPVLLMFDLWFLGYHHVISTFTRIGFDRASVRQHRFLVIQLPLLVLAGTLALAWGVGGWAIATLYLYWQWFHYTRQSYGVSRRYLAKGGMIALPYDRINTLALYAIPLTGILYRSWQAPEMFLGMDLRVLPVSLEMVLACGAAAVLCLLAQAVYWIRLYRQGALAPLYAMYMISHHIVFTVGYLLIDDINYGWLTLNVWHNAQYIMFVWLANNQRFRNGLEPEHPLISKISQNGRVLAYLGICLLITLFVYLVMSFFSMAAQYYTALPVALVCFMVINFHHYIVDAMIWKKKKAVSAMAPPL